MNKKLEDIKKIINPKERQAKLMAYCEALFLQYRADDIRHAHEEILRLLEDSTKARAGRELDTIGKYHKEFAKKALETHAFGTDIRRFTFWAFVSFLESVLMPHYDESNEVKHLLWGLAEQEENYPTWKAIRSAIADGVDEDLTYNHEAHEFAKMQAVAGWHRIPDVFANRN